MLMLLLFQTVAKHSNSKIQLGISISRHNDISGLVSLSFDIVSGAFFLWGFGLILSAFMLIIELFYHRYKESRKMSKFNFRRQLRLLDEVFGDIVNENFEN